jgi:hypothetical protein
MFLACLDPGSTHPHRALGADRLLELDAMLATPGAGRVAAAVRQVPTSRVRPETRVTASGARLAPGFCGPYSRRVLAGSAW